MLSFNLITEPLKGYVEQCGCTYFGMRKRIHMEFQIKVQSSFHINLIAVFLTYFGVFWGQNWMLPSHGPGRKARGVVAGLEAGFMNLRAALTDISFTEGVVTHPGDPQS